MPPTGRAWKRGKRDAKKVETSGTFLLIKNMQTLFFRDELPLLCSSRPVSSSQFGYLSSSQPCLTREPCCTRGKMKPRCALLAGWSKSVLLGQKPSQDSLLIMALNMAPEYLCWERSSKTNPGGISGEIELGYISLNSL